MNKKDYQDYVIKDGKLIAEFEKMYIESDSIPWNQNEHMEKEFIDIQIAICLLRKYQPFDYILDFGSGLGFF